MSVQQFCLRWNNHQPNFISVCSSLLHNGTLVDVTLAAEGRQLQAHKIVLSACSSYFQTLFTSNPCQHPIVILKDVQYNDLKTMVDFMYYGEVNVSQEQLPHILKTAEMLKIKGLAEMPDAAASFTKSDSKSSSEQIEQHQIASSGGSDSIWGSTESQIQHHPSHQQSQTHSQQQRRTPSPQVNATSPAARRKRLRKSSNSGSGERISEEQSSIDANTSTINVSHMGQMSFSTDTNLSSTINLKVTKDNSNIDTEIHPQDSSQESSEDTSNQQHHVQQIKPEADISSVSQAIPLDTSGPATPSEHDTPNISQSQSSHSGVQWTVVDSSYPRFSLSSCQASSSNAGKRSRFLIRQPRIKRDSDTCSYTLPEVEFNPVYSHPLLNAPPPKIERHASEPAPSTEPSSPYLLAVPQSTPFLMKQHSHPLLPSQSPPSVAPLTLHRQHSQQTSSSSITITDPISSPNSRVLPTIGLTQSTSMVHFITSPIKQELETLSKTDPQSSSVILVSEPTEICKTSSTILEHISPIRVKSEELQRSSSSPQAIREISIEKQRSSHCPVIRPGPALGCNFCWNTIDAHGRILRRKTKYHCPECQTNLCIVPCFQEYHERQSSCENPSSETTTNPLSNRSKSLTSTTVLTNYPKTDST